MIIIYITYPNSDIAKKIITILLKKKLIACTNIFNANSLYLEKGKIKTIKETVSIIKTKNNNWQKIKAEVIKNHPYKTPCIIKLIATANKEYIRWIEKEVR